MIDTRFQTAFQILLFIALNQERGQRSTSRELAASIGSNASYVRGMITPLIKCGILHSFSGKGGGIVLGRPPTEISLGELYKSVTSDAKIWSSRKSGGGDNSIVDLFAVLQEKAECAVLALLHDKTVSSSLRELKAINLSAQALTFDDLVHENANARSASI